MADKDVKRKLFKLFPNSNVVSVQIDDGPLSETYCVMDHQLEYGILSHFSETDLIVSRYMYYLFETDIVQRVDF